MDLRGLRYFNDIASSLSFSGAARRLNVSQSALSRQIQLLESELGLKLFDRLGRQISLTAAGRDLLVRSQAIMQDVAHLKSRALELVGGSKGALRIGATPQTLESLVSKVLTRYLRKRPDVEVTLVEEGSANLVGLVEQGQIHVALAALPPNATLDRRTLFPLGVLAVVPRGHRLTARAFANVDDVADEPLLVLRRGFMTRQLMDGAFQLVNATARIVLESGNPHCLLALVEAGHGIAIVPSTVVVARSTAYRVIPLCYAGRQLGLSISAIWDRRRYLSPAAIEFIDETYAWTRKAFPGRQYRFRKLIDTSNESRRPEEVAMRGRSDPRRNSRD